MKIDFTQSDPQIHTRRCANFAQNYIFIGDFDQNNKNRNYKYNVI